MGSRTNDPTILKRRDLTEGKRHHHVALAISSLGGPEPGHFTRAYMLATRTGPKGDIEKVIAETFRQRSKGIRYACTYCTAGHTAVTYDHHQFNICLKHNRWLAPGFGPEHQRRVPPGARWRVAERRYRRAARSRFLTRDLTENVWRIMRDQATILGPPDLTTRLRDAQDQPRFVEDVDDRLALYPDTVPVLALLAQPRTWYAVANLFAAPERLRAHLRRELAWVDGQRWVLVEALAEELIRSRRSRLRDIDALLRPHYEAEHTRRQSASSEVAA